MAKRFFYARLAAMNMRRDAKFYLPYLLTGVGCAAMFYIMFYLNGNRGIDSMRGAVYVQTMLFLGTGVVAIFSAVIIFYTNSFLMKRRKKELGLYNILGMEKRHIGSFLLWETIYAALICIVAGIGAGILLSKLMLLVLYSILGVPADFGFELSLPGVGYTAATFGVIFLLTYLTNLVRIGRAKPIELLRGGNTGDREPKTRWGLAVIGTLCLAGGYVIALMVRSPLSALALFFVAVLLVIAGTYCLFTAGSIAVLKAMRKNKRYYYKEKRFIAVSGMLHRMKRNAAGLASVCILSTMVLVTVSTTVCLYAGTEKVIDRMYPNDVGVIMFESDEQSMNEMISIIRDIAEENGAEDYSIECVRYYADTSVASANQSVGDALKIESAGGIIGEPSKPGQLPTVYIGIDFPGGTVPEVFEDFNFWDRLTESDVPDMTFTAAYSQLRAENADEAHAMHGGFLFIGIFLGILFLMATALIIYYKQVSEGYEDAEGYKIMQQVGMSRQSVRRSVHSQIMIVFFLPLVTSFVHIAFAFNMITRLLALFALSSAGFFALCMACTAAAFAAIYAAVYALTAKAYYGIVKA